MLLALALALALGHDSEAAAAAASAHYSRDTVAVASLQRVPAHSHVSASLVSAQPSMAMLPRHLNRRLKIALMLRGGTIQNSEDPYPYAYDAMNDNDGLHDSGAGAGEGMEPTPPPLPLDQQPFQDRIDAWKRYQQVRTWYYCYVMRNAALRN